jgi:uncharacterized protein
MGDVVASRHPVVLRRLIIVVTALVVAVGAASTRTAAAGKGFIWQLERDGKVGWLVGSIHVLSPDYYPLPDSMNKAFLRSVTLMEEVDVDEVNTPAFAEAIQSKGFYKGSQTLETQLSKETFRLIAERITRAGLPVESFRRMKPWMVGLTLMAVELKRGGFDSAYGLDRHFYNRAPRTGKRFRALETAVSQIEMFDRIGAEFKESLLKETIEGADTQLSQVKAMADAWRAGDVAALERVVLGPMKDEPKVYQMVIVERNHAWVPKIEECFAGGHCFVVVGAAHLLGPDGLLAIMKDKGYRVEQR